MEIDEACLDHSTDIEHLDDCNDAAPVEIANAWSHDSESITPSLPHSVSTLTHVYSTQFSHPLDQQSQSLQTRVTENPTTIVPTFSQSPYCPLSTWTPWGQNSPQTLACPVVAPSELIQVTDLVALFAGVTSTTPVAVETMSTPRTTRFSVPVLVDSGNATTPPPCQSLSHELGASTESSRYLSAVSPLEHSLGLDTESVVKRPPLLRVTSVRQLTSPT